MPHYFFHVKRGQVTILDQEGIELADTTEAEREAARRAREVLTKDGLQGRRGSSGTIIVADENWQPLFEFPFEDAKP
jgi:DNA-binding GntR family transcriptional regulator